MHARTHIHTYRRASSAAVAAKNYVKHLQMDEKTFGFLRFCCTKFFFALVFLPFSHCLLTHYIFHKTSCKWGHTQCPLNIASYTLALTHCILHITYYTFHLTYCILDIVSYTLHKSAKALFKKSLKT